MPKTITTNEELHNIMGERKLTRSEIAKLLYVNDSTVDRWLVPPKANGRRNPTFRAMPALTMRLLKLLLNR